jgi:hypothetical protein
MTRHQPEATLQRSVIAHLQWRARPGVWFTHIPLGGLRSKVEASILRGLGTVRGCPDLLIVADGKAYFLELKAPHGRVTPETARVPRSALCRRCLLPLRTDIDDAIERLEQWRLLRSNTSTTSEELSKSFAAMSRQGRAARTSAAHH